MRILDADAVERHLPFPDLMDALDAAFRAPVVTPVRHHHAIERGGEPNGMLLLMPAWTDMAMSVDAGSMIGIKIVTVMPGNAARSVASVLGSYLVLDGVTGAPMAMLDGTRLTLRRTAAASALAARRLARANATRLTMVGAGALAPHMIDAHASVLPITDVKIWNRDHAKAVALAARMADRPFPVRAVKTLKRAVEDSDVVSVATMSETPLVLGSWLSPGTHVDLVGAYTPRMRETDTAAIVRASVFVDTRGGALKEGGDLVIPLSEGAITADHVRADLFDLAQGRHRGRAAPDEITVFKSVGTALEDLAAAQMVLARAGGTGHAPSTGP
jgi:ornithine cyclodeaminase/alanine dehydrogenase-like protein (mu-crystallin family)